MLWADDKIIVDATAAFDLFTQFPDCQYDFQFTPLVMTTNGPVNFNIANSAIFYSDPTEAFFTFEKCSAATRLIDP